MLNRLFSSSSNASSSNTSNSVKLDNLNASSFEQAASIFSSGSRVFEIATDDPDINVLVFGCHGEDTKDQKQVAASMRELIAKEKIHFGITTGDNIYPHGARKADDEAFQQFFYQYYQSFPPVMVTLGNHDGNYSKIATWQLAGYSFNLKLLNPTSAYRETSTHGFQGLVAPTTGPQTEQNEVFHTYLKNTEEKIAALTKPKVTFAELRDAKLEWVMPAQYYSYIIGKLQFIHLNSNTLVKDFLDTTSNNTTENQISWLNQVYQAAKKDDRQVVIIQHHSLFTCGKRVYHGDQDHYLTLAQINQVEAIFNEKKLNYNDMLLKIFQRLEIKPKLILSAHDHSLYYHNNKKDPDHSYKIAQVISGGGGGKLQGRSGFKQPIFTPVFLKQHGFCQLSFNQHNPEEIFIHYRTRKQHLIFSSEHHSPIRIISLDSQVEALRVATLQACEKYFTFVDTRQTESHGKFFTSNVTHNLHDINLLHEMQAYFNQHTGLPSFEITLKELKNYVLKISNLDSTHSFKVYLDTELRTAFADNMKLLTNYFDMPNTEPASPSFRS